MLSLPNLFAQHKANRKLICLLICIFSGVCFDVPAPHSLAFCISSERVSLLEFFFSFPWGIYEMPQIKEFQPSYGHEANFSQDMSCLVSFK
jgi:hypothetical protein